MRRWQRASTSTRRCSSSPARITTACVPTVARPSWCGPRPCLWRALVREGRARELRGIGPAIEAAAARARRDRRHRRAGRAAALDAARAGRTRPAARARREAGDRDRRGARHRDSSEFRAAAERGTAARGARHRPEDGGEDPRGAGERATRPLPRLLLPQAARSPRASLPRSAGSWPVTRGAGWTRRRGSRSSSRPRIRPTCRERFAELPEIVALLDSGHRHHAGGRAVRARRRAAGSELGTALVRATGPAEHVAALGELPTRRDEAGLYACARPRRSRRPRSATAGLSACRRSSSSRARSAATCTRTRRGPTAGRRCSRWARRRANAATSTSRSATTRRT